MVKHSHPPSQPRAHLGLLSRRWGGTRYWYALSVTCREGGRLATGRPGRSKRSRVQQVHRELGRDSTDALAVGPVCACTTAQDYPQPSATGGASPSSCTATQHEAFQRRGKKWASPPAPAPCRPAAPGGASCRQCASGSPRTCGWGPGVGARGGGLLKRAGAGLKQQQQQQCAGHGWCFAAQHRRSATHAPPGPQCVEGTRSTCHAAGLSYLKSTRSPWRKGTVPSFPTPTPSAWHRCRCRCARFVQRWAKAGGIGAGKAAGGDMGAGHREMGGTGEGRHQVAQGKGSIFSILPPFQTFLFFLLDFARGAPMARMMSSGCSTDASLEEADTERTCGWRGHKAAWGGWQEAQWHGGAARGTPFPAQPRLLFRFRGKREAKPSNGMQRTAAPAGCAQYPVHPPARPSGAAPCCTPASAPCCPSPATPRSAGAAGGGGGRGRWMGGMASKSVHGRWGRLRLTTQATAPQPGPALLPPPSMHRLTRAGKPV